MNVEMLAVMLGQDVADVQRTMDQMAQIIRDRFQKHNIPNTQENVGKAIIPALQLMIDMGQRYFDDPEFRTEMQNKMFDQLEAELKGEK